MIDKGRVSMMELRMENVSKNYGTLRALSNVTYTFSEGIYGLLGANGSGKTTMMRLLCNLQTPSGGRILFDGKDMKAVGEDYRDQLGYLPQNFGYYPDFTCYKFLMYVATIKGISKKKAPDRIMEVLALVDLADVKDKQIRYLSGGMRQRLGIAQAILNDPKLLILDEPTVGVDPQERVKFRNLIHRIAHGRTVILSTHIVSDIEYTATELVFMRMGEIVGSGTPDRLLQELDGQIWECDVPHREADKYYDMFRVISQTNHEENCTLRLFYDGQPMQGARQVKANLEDLYLYHFEKRG